MNRTLIVVQTKPKTFCSIRIHWNYGEEVENWLKPLELPAILNLLAVGHRSTIEEAYRNLSYNNTPEDCDYWKHNTLREAKNNCEYMTLAYYNGKKWKFTHNN